MNAKAKVVIVDDEPDVLESTAILVESLGYEPVQVSEASKILDTLEREQPAVLLQDLKMPGLNVSGLVASLRSNPATAEIPIVFFSANADLPGMAARYDVWGYLAKPFGKQELARLLDEAMGLQDEIPKKSGRDLQREVRSVFHDYWNLLAALSNYVVILDDAKDLSPSLKKSVRGLDDLVLQLESKTDRLQSYLMALLQSMEAEGQPSSPDTMRGS
jgi:FixJ family two-component response regulator